MVVLLWVMKMNCTLRDISRTMSQKRPTLFSSSGASTSSSRQNGAGFKIEYRKHQRDRGERLLAARQLADGAVALARRTRHHGDAGFFGLLFRDFEIGVAAAEQTRKFLLQSGIHPIEGVLETRPRLAIDLAHRRFERLQRIGQILALAVQVLLALRLFLELADGRQVHLPQRSIFPLVSSSCRFPGFHALASAASPAPASSKTEARGRQLFGDALAAYAHLLRGKPGLVQRGTCRFDPLLDRGLVRLALTQQRVQFLAGDARGMQLAFHLRARRERPAPDPPAARRAEHRRRVQLPQELVAARRGILQLLAQPFERRLQAGEACEVRRDSTWTASSRARCCAACAAARARILLASHPLPLASSSMRCGSSAANTSMAVSMAAARRAQFGLRAVELGAHIGEARLELCRGAVPHRLCAPARNRALRAYRRVRGAVG